MKTLIWHTNTKNGVIFFFIRLKNSGNVMLREVEGVIIDFFTEESLVDTKEFLSFPCSINGFEVDPVTGNLKSSSRMSSFSDTEIYGFFRELIVLKRKSYYVPVTIESIKTLKNPEEKVLPYMRKTTTYVRAVKHLLKAIFSGLFYFTNDEEANFSTNADSYECFFIICRNEK